MVYRYGRRYRSYRYRGWSNAPSKYNQLQSKFGPAVSKIKLAFFNLDAEAMDDLLSDYGSFHGASAERYARDSILDWRRGAKNMSGQTMERLVELVPPYLAAEQRFDILQNVIRHNERAPRTERIEINLKEPEEGLAAVDAALDRIRITDDLAYLPSSVMDAASWLYDDDATAARAVLVRIAAAETQALKKSAERELGLLKRTIASGQIKTASYTVETPAGNLVITASVPSKCFVATVAFGENDARTETLRIWRDTTLVKSSAGRRFIDWYYRNGEVLSFYLGMNTMTLAATRIALGGIVILLSAFLKIHFVISGDKNVR
jgi:hypothetical protein